MHSRCVYVYSLIWSAMSCYGVQCLVLWPDPGLLFYDQTTRWTQHQPVQCLFVWPFSLTNNILINWKRNPPSLHSHSMRSTFQNVKLRTNFEFFVPHCTAARATLHYCRISSSRFVAQEQEPQTTRISSTRATLH